MADLTITANSVVYVSGSKVTGVAGETLTAGQCVYLKSSDSKVYKADANVTAVEADSLGIALHATVVNQPITYQVSGDITIGATTAVAVTYIVSATAGGIAPHVDLASGSYLTYLGYGISTTVIRLSKEATGFALA